ncbi:hypothetical protein LXL04_001340 [Taraxacum kok-saghyz]
MSDRVRGPLSNAQTPDRVRGPSPSPCTSKPIWMEIGDRAETVFEEHNEFGMIWSSWNEMDDLVVGLKSTVAFCIMFSCLQTYPTCLTSIGSQAGAERKHRPAMNLRLLKAKESAIGKYTRTQIPTPEHDKSERKAKNASTSNTASPGLNKTDNPSNKTRNGKKLETKNINVYTLLCNPLLMTEIRIRRPSQNKYPVNTDAKTPRKIVLNNGTEKEQKSEEKTGFGESEVGYDVNTAFASEEFEAEDLGEAPEDGEEDEDDADDPRAAEVSELGVGLGVDVVAEVEGVEDAKGTDET